METRWSCSSNGEGQNSYLTNTTWDTWDISTPPSTPYDWRLHQLLFDPNSMHHRVPDQHVMCLNLGKRYYCEDAVVPARQGQVAAESSAATKRGKVLYPSCNYYVTDTDMVSPPMVVVPRCQVEGCHLALGDAKEYYRKHKVCEMHSKAPKVVVLGLQQRFCQQCSRFHRVTEFDEAKRSCRRRLKGHNQRRRKVTLSNTMSDRQLRPLPPSPSPSQPRRAFSLLSSPETQPWNISNDLSSRSSAALYELIAANRATSVYGHLLNQNTVSDNTLADVKQGPALEFGRKGPLKSSGHVNAEECTDYGWGWGANVV